MKNALYRIYIADSLAKNNTIRLDNSLAHYLFNVLRSKTNQLVKLFNGRDGEFLAEITQINHKQATLVILDFLSPPRPKPELIIAPALIKPDRFATMIDMAVQLGISKIIPVITEYTNTRTLNYPRFEKIITEAIEQSEQFSLPNLEPICSLVELLKNYNNYTIITALERSITTKPILSAPLKNIILLTGPEGGFAPKEISLISESNCYIVNLGQNILRAETAMLSLVTQIQMLRTSIMD